MYRLYRRVTLLIGGLLLVLVNVLPAAAFQEATPAAGLADLGLPEIVLNASDDAIEGIPERLEAGRYLVTVNVADDAAFGGGVAFVQPAGMSAAEFLAALSGPSPDAGQMATPDAMAEATPVGGEGMGGPPPLVYEATHAGGVFAFAGQTGQAVVDLTPGQWIAWGDDPTAPQEPVIIEVTGEMPAALPEPEASATIVMADMTFDISEGALRAGPQVVEIQNAGVQPHLVFLFKGPDDMTEEQVTIALEEDMAAGMSGTPAAYSGLNPDEDLMPAAYTSTQSSGTTMWATWNLEPGTYLLICFFPDRESGLPHLYLGMWAVVEVAE